MKKLINQIDSVVTEQMEGLIATWPHLQANYAPRYVWCKQTDNAVALISGGGSGHEPLHAGFVGMGMLTGACPGEIFTSPTPDQMIECAKAVDNGSGVLFFIKNYTGDILNFETAVEMLHEEGIAVGTVIIDDDVAVKDSLYTAGRRGVAGTVFVEKIVGAAALQGYNLGQCEQLGKDVNNAPVLLASHCQPVRFPPRENPHLNWLIMKSNLVSGSTVNPALNAALCKI